MDDNFETLSQLSENFLRTESQSAFTDFSQDSSFVNEALIDALRLDPVADFDEEQDEIIELPKHACSYCGYHEPSSVAQCTICDKWFCNGKGNTAASHIVTHMVRSGHRELTLHREGPLGDAALECYSCGSKNVFMLGYITAKADSVVVMLCRIPCAQQAAQKSNNWQTEDWKPLIDEKQIVLWLVKVPTHQQQMRVRQITTSKINRLEELWKEHTEATVEDLDRPGIDQDPEPVRLRYEDGNQYFSILNPLVGLEGEYDRKAKEAMNYAVSQVRWDVGLNKKVTASFNLPEFRDGNLKLMIGDELRLKHQQTVDGSDWTCEGRIVKIPDNHSDKFVLELSQNCELPSNKRTNFMCEFVWKGTAFKRMREALLRLANRKSCVSQFIYHKLMGHDVHDIKFKIRLPKRLETPGLPSLNHSQEEAVRNALLQPLSLIQGPPGTGKTVTSAALVYQMVKFTKEQVLVCAPSNIAVDQLAEKLHLTGLKVIRFCAKGREAIDSPVSFLTLHNQLKALQGATELHKLMRLKEEVGELSQIDESRFKQLIMAKEKELLGKAEVICCTCIAAADPRLRDREYRCVLVDESTQATEPEVMVSILRGVRQLVLVGDHCQLGPVVLCKKAGIAGLSRSLVERLVMLGNRPMRLQVQYRMHPALSAFPSNVFYEGSLQNGVTEADRVLRNINWRFPTPDPMMFWNCSGQEEISPSGTSFLNRAEAIAVEKLTTRFLQAGFKPEQIGIITPYEGQRAYIVNYMQNQGTLHSKLYLDVEAQNVDAFQGREKDIIIMTCVRSNSSGGIGFLNDPRRLNVALTRAKYGLIVVGNAKVLARQLLWNNLLTMFRDKGCLVEGALNNLKKSHMELPKPKSVTEREVRAHGYLNLAIFSNENNAHEQESSQQSPTQQGGRVPQNFEDPQGAIYSNANMVNFPMKVEESDNFEQKVKRKRGRGGKKRNKENNEERKSRESYDKHVTVKENERFFDYCKRQQFVPEDEFQAFEDCMRVELPSSFRISQCLPERDEFVSFLQKRFFEPLRKIEDENIHCPEPIPFIPYAYQTNNTRAAIRSTPKLNELHQLLISEMSNGTISRQEAVSMVPPLLLDIQPHHYVLDACASPGSKTMQIVELMHKDNKSPEGLLVANDVDNSRCYLLVHQTLKRFPTTNCVVVNHDASIMPAPVNKDGQVMLYDRILCDVICSGDGTLRKNIELWKSWEPNKALHLHKLQIRIATRCLRMLKVGGLMAYSTCSLNPIEDESVLAQLLRTFNGCLELVDVSDQMPDLKRSPGISKWKVISNKMVEYESFEDVAAERFICESMFSPTDEEAKEFNLNRSFRILPHSQNSGGFFVALLRKTADFRTKLDNDVPQFKPAPAKKRRTVREDPFIFLPNDEEFKEELDRIYGIGESFPFHNLLVRNINNETKRCVYMVNDALREFIQNNSARFHLVNAGTNVMRRVEKIGCSKYRLSQDGLSALFPYISKRVVELSIKDMQKVLVGSTGVHYARMSELEEKEKFLGIPAGSVILQVKHNGFSREICAWMGVGSVSAFITREEKIHLLNMLGYDTTELQIMAHSSRKEKAQKKAKKGLENGDNENDVSIKKEEESFDSVEDESGLKEIKMEHENVIKSEE